MNLIFATLRLIAALYSTPTDATGVTCYAENANTCAYAEINVQGGIVGYYSGATVGDGNGFYICTTMTEGDCSEVLTNDTPRLYAVAVSLCSVDIITGKISDCVVTPAQALKRITAHNTNMPLIAP